MLILNLCSPFPSSGAVASLILTDILSWSDTSHGIILYSFVIFQVLPDVYMWSILEKILLLLLPAIPSQENPWVPRLASHQPSTRSKVAFSLAILFVTPQSSLCCGLLSILSSMKFQSPLISR